MTHRKHRTKTLGRAAIAAAAMSMAWLAPSAAPAGEWFPRASALLARKPSEEAKTGELKSAMNWWSIPRPARVAAKKLAKEKDATVTRCVAIEQGDKVAYEIHASHKLGLFKRDDFVLTGVTEPLETAEKRREEQTLRRRFERLREKGTTLVKGKPESDRNKDLVSPGSSAFPPR